MNSHARRSNQNQSKHETGVWMKVMIVAVVVLVLVGVPASADESLSPRGMMEMFESKCLKHAGKPLHIRSMAQVENWAPFDGNNAQLLAIQQGRGWTISENPEVSLLLFDISKYHPFQGCALWFTGEGFEDYEIAIEEALDVQTIDRASVLDGRKISKWRLDYDDNSGWLVLTEMEAPIVPTTNTSLGIEYSWID